MYNPEGFGQFPADEDVAQESVEGAVPEGALEEINYVTEGEPEVYERRVEKVSQIVHPEGTFIREAMAGMNELPEGSPEREALGEALLAAIKAEREQLNIQILNRYSAPRIEKLDNMVGKKIVPPVAREVIKEKTSLAIDNLDVASEMGLQEVERVIPLPKTERGNKIATKLMALIVAGAPAGFLAAGFARAFAKRAEEARKREAEALAESGSTPEPLTA